MYMEYQAEQSSWPEPAWLVVGQPGACNRVWRGVLGIWNLTKIRCGIRENEKYLDGIRDLTATREAGFAKIWP